MWAYIIAGSFAIIVIVIINFIRKLFGISEYHSKSEKQDPELVKRREGQFPPTYPNGWLPVLETKELGKGECKSVFALGKDLVLFRGSSGKVHVLDAYCPHLGANLGVGGTVIGDQIKCPFHGWQFNGEGQTTFIPGTDCKNFSSVRVKPYENCEVNGFIYLWNHSEGKDPDWFLEEFKAIENFEYRGKIDMEMNNHVQEFLENSGDLVHFFYVHKPYPLYNPSDWFMKLILKFYEMKFNLNWKACTEPESHCAEAVLNVEHIFLGIFQLRTRFSFKFQGLGCNRPIIEIGNYKIPINVGVITLGPLRQRLVFHFYTKTSIIDIILGKILIYALFKNSEGDEVIWNDKTYIPNAPLTKNEGNLKTARRWVKQFYSDSKSENVSVPSVLDDGNYADETTSFSLSDFC